MATLHKGERPFDCELCHMPHLQPAYGSPPISHRFQCNQCDAKCKTNSDLERHSRVHADEKPYKCELRVPLCHEDQFKIPRAAETQHLRLLPLLKM
ncbi:zinc finger protein 454-like [Carassius carassius]|uniref:zinc finger protein 454-like n=1 Tax=Carassius carassius TaxID=217509 RepID=UPI002868F49D|nr:zinc finger protein 454-like [Carassius carassius]